MITSVPDFRRPRPFGSAIVRCSLHHARIVLFFIFLLPGSALTQTLLVDFASQPGDNAFGHSGWETVINADVMEYTADGPGGIVTMTGAGEYDDYRGVRGLPRQFRPTERIVVTWYNRSEEPVRFTARISFTDADEPDGGISHGLWYTMRNAANYRETWTEIAPHGQAQSSFAIRSHGVHKTDSLYGLVNINLAIEWGMNEYKPQLVCDRIELFDDVDRIPPGAPTAVHATWKDDSNIRLAWEAPGDNVAVTDYLIYLDGEVEGYSREESYTCVFLEADTEYQLSVTALDEMGNESVPSPVLHTRTAQRRGGVAWIEPVWLGAFRLPEDFNWGGEAIAYRADGDGGQSGGGAADGFPGSLFASNVNQAEQGFVGEVSIPAAAMETTGNLEALPVATLLNPPVNIRPFRVEDWDFVDIWRTGLEYLPEEARLYSAWSVHYSVSGLKHPGICCTDVTRLATGPHHGPWYLGSPDEPPIDSHTGDYLFAVPESWAATYLGGRRLLVGRYRDGGLSGLGPTLYAVAPVGATPPLARDTLSFLRLLQYGPVAGTDNYNYPFSINGYNHSDEWRGAFWMDGGAHAAVGMVGSKGHGRNWYGYHGEGMHNDWVSVDVPYPDFYATDPDGKGWRADSRSVMLLLFDAADLANVASGRIASSDPQPYTAFRLDTRAHFFSTAGEIVSVAYTGNDQRLLYVTEFVREAEATQVIHVFHLDALPTHMDAQEQALATQPEISVHPNPFHAISDITFDLPEASSIQLRVFDILGRQVTLLDEGRRPAGSHSIRLDASRHGLSPGVYFVVLSTAQFSVSRMLLLR
ncbi:MAG: T9SS type A sorting domain-containing protein [Bacteroidetes bacterium]|nr:T9SS type A sorting domain-containing protein [Bacteroidota bacterium]